MLLISSYSAIVVVLTINIDGLHFFVQVIVQDKSKEELQNIVLQLLDSYPGIAFDILEDAPAPSGHGFHPHPSGEDLPWCVCGRCRDMPKEIEKLCCGKIQCVSLYPVRTFYAY